MPPFLHSLAPENHVTPDLIRGPAHFADNDKKAGPRVNPGVTSNRQAWVQPPA